VKHLAVIVYVQFSGRNQRATGRIVSKLANSNNPPSHSSVCQVIPLLFV